MTNIPCHELLNGKREKIKNGFRKSRNLQSINAHYVCMYVIFKKLFIHHPRQKASRSYYLFKEYIMYVCVCILYFLQETCVYAYQIPLCHFMCLNCTAKAMAGELRTTFYFFGIWSTRENTCI